MELFNITSATKEKDDSIQLTIDDPATGKNDVLHFADIRIGINWPTSTSHSCFVAVSQEYTRSPKPDEDEAPVGKRQVIAEHISQSLGMNRFYVELVQFAKKTLSHNLYAVLPEDRLDCGYLQDLETFARQSECNIYVNAAMDENDFFLSISRIRDSLDNGSLCIPEDTVVFDQLKMIAREDLQDKPEERFYSIAALGHVLDGFYRWPPRNYPLVTKRRRPPDWRYC